MSTDACFDDDDDDDNDDDDDDDDDNIHSGTSNSAVPGLSGALKKKPIFSFPACISSTAVDVLTHLVIISL